MPEDTRDYIEQTQSRAMDYTGKELSPDEMAREFAKLDIDARVSALQSLAAENGPLTISEAATRSAYEGPLRRTHEALRRIAKD